MKAQFEQKIFDYDDVESIIKNDEFTSDSDKDWLEGFVRGCRLCGIIDVDDEEEFIELIAWCQENNYNNEFEVVYGL